MSRLPLDSFLPSGAISDHPHDHYPALSYAKLVNGASPYSVISPLALPRSVSQASDFPTATNGAGGVPSHPPTSHPQQRQSRPLEQQSHQNYQQYQDRYLSSHRSPPPTTDRRAMSPSHHHLFETGSGLISPSLVPFNDLSSPEQTALQLRRVTLQNRRLLENWEAERAHLEANRGRAEEIYKEERAIMDEERLVWAETEAQYRSKIQQLEQEVRDLQQQLEQQSTGRNGTQPDTKGRGSESSGRLGSPTNDRIPPLRFQTFQATSPPSAGPSGRTMPVSDPFVPLDPRLQSVSPQNESGGSETPSQDHVPSIDVKEILPHLEGIPLKTTAIQKATFTDGSSSKKESPTGSNSGSPADSKSKTSPAELTQKTMRAPEQARLVMHAGHTPNHSISLLSTSVSTVVPNTAGSSGAATPLQDPSEAVLAEGSQTESQLTAPWEFENDVGGNPEDPQQRFVPSDEGPPLAEPMMIRNMPAKDEIFLQRVVDKLKDSIDSNNATPTVLKQNAMEVSEGQAQPELSENVPVEGGNDSNSLEDDEPSDIPLKLRNTQNFGAPLGSVGNTGF